MDLFRVYSHPIAVEYRGRLLSETTFFFLLVSLGFRYLVPLLIVWQSDGVWLKQSLHHEMADVQFKKRLILLVEGFNKQTGTYEQYRFGTFQALDNHPHLNDHNDHLGPIQMSEYEHHQQLNAQISVPIDMTQFQVYCINLILFFDYRLSSRIDLRMESLAQIHTSTPIPGQSVRLVGMLEMVQHTAFYHRGFDYRYNRSLILRDTGEWTLDDDAEVQKENHQQQMFDLEHFLQVYYQRDCKCITDSFISLFKFILNSIDYTKFSPQFIHWRPSMILQGVANLNSAELFQFKIDLTLNYHHISQLEQPEKYQQSLTTTTFIYQTSLWYLMKWAFVQYLAIWIIIDWAIKKLEHIVYGEYLVPTVKMMKDKKILFGFIQNDHKEKFD